MIIRNVKLTDIDAIIKYEKLTAQTSGYLVSIPTEGILKNRIRLSESGYLDDITMGWFPKTAS